MKNVAILGGGVSGLSTAFHLIKHSKNIGLNIPKIKLFEGQNNYGGWMKSIRCGQNQEDYFDLGPRTITTNSYASTNVISMASEIGLADKIKPVTKLSKNFNKRFIVVDGKIRQLPSKFKDLFIPEKPFKPFITYLLKDIRKGALTIKDDDDLSVDQFFRLRFGDDIADYLINPMCIGITGGNSKELSIKSVFPNLFSGEQKYGSVMKSLILSKTDRFKDLRDDPLVQKSIQDQWSVFSFQGGIGTFSESLAKHLQNQNINLSPGNEAKELKFVNNSKCEVNGEVFDHVFSSIPAYGLSSILTPENAQLKEALLEIPFVDMGVVSFKFPAEVKLPQNMNGFGFLVPSSENSPVLGVIFDSLIFDDETTSKFTVMLGGYRFKELFGSAETVSKDHLIDISRAGLSKYLHINAEPLDIVASVHKKCIPQYKLGHAKRLSTIQQHSNDLPLSLVGSSYHGFSVPDCVYNAKLQAIKYVEKEALIQK